MTNVIASQNLASGQTVFGTMLLTLPVVGVAVMLMVSGSTDPVNGVELNAQYSLDNISFSDPSQITSQPFTSNTYKVVPAASCASIRFSVRNDAASSVVVALQGTQV